MDHLPKIDNPAFPPFEVPCLCQPDDYDQKGFLDFPRRRGWTIDNLRGPLRSDQEDQSPETVNAFLQAWLFFGLLHDVLWIAGVKVRPEEFLEGNGDHHIVTTASLPQYLKEWATREGDQSLSVRKCKQSQVAEMLFKVNNFFVRFVDYPRPDKWCTSIPSEVLLSILILGETLHNAALLIWRCPPGEPHPLKSVGLFRSQNPLKRYFEGARWCSNEVTMLENTVDNTGLYIASLLRRPSFSTEKLHLECTSQDCYAYQVDNATYKTAHTRDCSDPFNCSSVFVDDRQVSSILEDGDKIPVVSLTSIDVEDGRQTLKVITSSTYVAISHVWAHGLGNVDANSLPLCQITRLRELIVQLSQSTQRCIQPALWIDTLCVPVAKHLNDYRKLAITKMAETYRRANQVLVLDMELQQTLSTSSRTELTTRILCCGWMRRLWTLQEALLSDDRPNCRKLYIQFSDGSIPFNSLIQTGILTLQNSEKALGALFSRLPQYGNVAGNFSTLTRALEYRKTSRPKDEALCLISILGGDMKRLADIESADERMQAFYSMLKELPSEILFHKGRSLNTDGYRWAPMSFLSSCKSQVALTSSRAPLATHDSQGLYVKFPGFLVSVDKNMVGTRYGLYFQDPERDQKRHHLTVYQKRVDYTVDFVHTMHKEVQRNKRFLKLILDADRPAVIVNGSDEDRSEAVLVAVLREANDTIYCRYLHRAQVFPIDSRPEQDSVMITIQNAAVNQRWCIG